MARSIFSNINCRSTKFELPRKVAKKYHGKAIRMNNIQPSRGAIKVLNAVRTEKRYAIAMNVRNTGSTKPIGPFPRVASPQQTKNRFIEESEIGAPRFASSLPTASPRGWYRNELRAVRTAASTKKAYVMSTIESVAILVKPYVEVRTSAVVKI